MGRKEPDIFDLVKRRKDDINKRQATVDRREKNQAELDKKLEDPIFRDVHRKLQQQRTIYTGSPQLRRKVLAEREKSNNPLNVEDSSTSNARRSFNLNRKRNFIVALTNPKYHCPRCGDCKTKMSEWFVSPDKKKVMCRSCVLSFGWKIKGDPMKNVELWTKIIKYYRINAIDLGRKRVAASKTIQQFADIVGWTADYQYKLESGRVGKLNEEAMKDLAAAFERLGIEIELDVWGDAMERYVHNGKAIRERRIACNLSTRKFAEQAGWTSANQRKIENGKNTTISKEKMKVMSTILE